MNFYHFSKKPLGKIRSVKQTNLGIKPDGFWFSVEDEWKDWCDCEGFAQDRLTYRSQVFINTENMLVLKTEKDIVDFRDEYDENWVINWSNVAQKYDGILIEHYYFNLRYQKNMTWYYVWDVASGCIWNKKAIDRIVPIIHDV